ncbi:MAG: hypothetical protein Alpg2KO_31440 [Alphaproteobacteria bacterium]
MKKTGTFSRGATGGAYALMVGLVAVVALGAVTGTGDSVNSLMTTTSDSMGNVIADPSPSPAPSASPSPDLEPDAFDFADQSGVNPSTVITSNMVTITGIDGPADVSVSGDGSPEFSVNGDTFSNTPRTIDAGQTLQMRMTSSGSLSGAVTAQITVGDLNDGMTVTTAGSVSAFSFTTCGHTGRSGPSQSQCNSSYSSGSLSGQVTVSSGYQIWTVPYSGTYRLDLSGAGGGNASGYSYTIGRGARIEGDRSFTAGQQLMILVGQQGGSAFYSGGGGGGTFVTLGNSYSTSSIVAAAGGGGGEGASGGNAYHATTSTSGSSTNNSSSGSGGNGGNSSGSTGWGGAGSGFLNNGGSGGSYGGQSYAFRNGGAGGPASNSCGHAATGGFGGGGGNGCWGGGGGGGYSGGGSGGGGGASYTSGLSNLSTTTTYQTGHGYVTITYLGP